MSSTSPGWQITARDRELLAALDFAPFTARQLHKLSRTWSEAFSSARLVRERMQRLAAAKLVKPHRYAILRPGQPENYYVLSREGYTLVHGPDNEPPTKGCAVAGWARPAAAPACPERLHRPYRVGRARVRPQARRFLPREHDSAGRRQRERLSRLLVPADTRQTTSSASSPKSTTAPSASAPKKTPTASSAKSAPTMRSRTCAPANGSGCCSSPPRTHAIGCRTSWRRPPR